MNDKKERWQDELLVDPRPLTSEEKDRIREFIQNYSQKSLKRKPMNQAKKKLNKKPVKA
jgi:hypothetical protein